MLGGTSLALGLLGLALPLLPTVPFLLLAGWCFARGEPRFEAWLLAHPRLGPSVRGWREHGVISLQAKVTASMAIGASAAVVALTVPIWQAKTALLGVLIGALLFVSSRPSTPHRMVGEPSAPHGDGTAAPRDVQCEATNAPKPEGGLQD